jgi:hypothetical protein
MAVPTSFFSTCSPEYLPKIMGMIHKKITIGNKNTGGNCIFRNGYMKSIPMYTNEVPRGNT